MLRPIWLPETVAMAYLRNDLILNKTGYNSFGFISLKSSMNRFQEGASTNHQPFRMETGCHENSKQLKLTHESPTI
jgi:hypothetical protein